MYLGLLVAQGQVAWENASERTIRVSLSWIRRLCLLVTIGTLAGLLCAGAAFWRLVDLGTLGGLHTLMIVLFVAQLVPLGLATVDIATPI